MWAFSSDGKARLAVKRRRDGMDDRSDADRLLDSLARDTRLAQRPIMGVDNLPQPLIADTAIDQSSKSAFSWKLAACPVRAATRCFRRRAFVP